LRARTHALAAAGAEEKNEAINKANTHSPVNTAQTIEMGGPRAVRAAAPNRQHSPAAVKQFNIFQFVCTAAETVGFMLQKTPRRSL